VLAAGLPALWLLVGLQQAYHVPYTMEGNAIRVRPPAALLDRAGITRRRLWRLDPWAAPPGDLTRYWRIQYRPNPSPGDRTSAQRALEYVARLDGDLLSEDMTGTVTTGKRIYVQPFEFTQLAEQGVWDQQPLLDAIRGQQFAAVLLRFRLGEDPGFHVQRINQPLIAAIADAYRLDATYGSYFLYRPK
jgi:hypothetical protein